MSRSPGEKTRPPSVEPLKTTMSTPTVEMMMPKTPSFRMRSPRKTTAASAMIAGLMALITEAVTGLDPEGLNNTNRLRLHVFGDRGGDQARLVALLDNLGKGASGAAVQNLNIMLGLDEAAGLA